MGLISYTALAFTADGTANGVVTVSSTTDLRKAATVSVYSDTVGPVQLVIDEILSSTTLAVKVLSGYNYVRYDVSGLTVVDNATIVQPEQFDFYTLDDTTIPGYIGIKDEGTLLNPAAASINFVGSGVSADASGNITIPGEPYTLGQALTLDDQLVLASYTDDSATPGNRTVNKVRGKSSLAAGATTCVITNSFCTANSQVIVTIESTDATALYVRSVVPSGTGFTLTMGPAVATANIKFSWTVIN